MLFDIPVKEKSEDLFNFVDEFNKLKSQIKERERLIIVKGPRRVGKTSMMKVVYNELDLPKAWIDGRKIFAGVSAEGLLYDAFLSILQDLKLEERVIARIKSVSLGGFGAGFSQPKPNVIVEELDKELRKKKMNAVVFIDEAQLLKKQNVDRFLAYVYDNIKPIQLVVAGSQVGLVDEFVGKSAIAPLFGRAKSEILLGRLPKDKARSFLKMGFSEAKVKVPDQDIENAISIVDGLIGWLNYYGHYRSKYSHNKAMEILKKDAVEITGSELKRFLNSRKGKKQRYVTILKTLVSGAGSWEDLKRALELKEKKGISDSRMHEYLRDLLDYSLVEKQNGGYVLSDPLIKEALRASG